MSIVVKIIILIFSTLIVVFNLFIFIKYRKVEYEKTGLKVFLLEDFFFLGWFVSEKRKYAVNGKRIRKLEEIYDTQTASKIARSAKVAPVSYFMVFSPVLLFTLVITENFVAVLCMLLIVIFLMLYFDIWLDGILRVRHEKILKEFSTVLSKMSLLVNAGITASEAFERVANSSEGILYDEMKCYTKEISNGRTINEALESFVFKCNCKEVRKFASLYKQNLIKGGPEFPFLLQDMAVNAWEERKSRAKVVGAKAEQKLLIPIMFMFIGVLIMIIVPAFNSLL